jgi:HAD superfamily hydrolase (TIGR01509 family)
MKYHAILFDCAGTLVDSEPLTSKALAKQASAYGIPISVEQADEQFRGLPLADCIEHLEIICGSPLPNSFRAACEDYVQYTFQRHLKPVAGVVELIHSLRIPYGVISRESQRVTELNLSKCGLLHHFQGRIFSADDLELRTPAPELLRHAARSFRVLPDRCAVVADSIPGMFAGVHAGMKVFALDNGLPRSRLPTGVHVVDSLTQLIPLL